MLEKVEISNAEWDVMRVIWALGETTSRTDYRSFI